MDTAAGFARFNSFDNRAVGAGFLKLVIKLIAFLPFIINIV